MKLTSLKGGPRSANLELGDAVGLIGFVADGDPVWGGYVATLHEAFANEGTHRGPAPVVEGPSGPLTVGTPAFEARLARVIGEHVLTRDHYAAIWFGAGSVEVWMDAAASLLQGPNLTRELQDLARAASAESRASLQAPASVGDWVRRLIGEAQSDVERLTPAQSGTEELTGRLLTLRAEAAEVAGDLEAGMMSWVRERQDAETRLLLYRDREQELRRRLSEIEDRGAEAPCQSCERPLGDRLDVVQAARQEEWEGVVQDGRWWRRRRDQLEFKPEELKEIEARALELGASMDDASEELERRKIQARELEVARVRLEHLAELQARIGDSTDQDPDTEDDRSAAHAAERVRDARNRLEESTRSRLRARIHGKVVALTGGRLVGGFPGLFADWTAGGRRGGGEVSILELAARITMAELAVEAGLELGSVLFPTSLDRLNGEDLPRALGDLARLTRKIPLLVVKATEQVAAAAPERFDLLYRVEGEGRKIRRQRSGLGAIWLQGP